MTPESIEFAAAHAEAVEAGQVAAVAQTASIAAMRAAEAGAMRFSAALQRLSLATAALVVDSAEAAGEALETLH